MATQSYPLVVCEIIEIPSDLRMINFRCKVAWEMFGEVPSLKFSKSSSSVSDEEFQCEEAEVRGRDETPGGQNDLGDAKYLDTETGPHEEKTEKKLDEICSDEDQISYSDIIFSIPIQKQSGDAKDPADSADNEGIEKCEDEGPGLQSMLLNNFVTDIQNNPGKKGLSRRRLRKSLIDNNL